MRRPISVRLDYILPPSFEEVVKTLWGSSESAQASRREADESTLRGRRRNFGQARRI
jgi:hypothetical protein